MTQASQHNRDRTKGSAAASRCWQHHRRKSGKGATKTPSSTCVLHAAAPRVLRQAGKESTKCLRDRKLELLVLPTASAAKYMGLHQCTCLE
eukprot:2205744-Lingulodinium_polyedra.AAC.1